MFAKYLLLAMTLASNLGPATGSSLNSAALFQGGPESTIKLVPYTVKQTSSLWVTAYSSTPEETDDTPFTTASGTEVRDGIVATNLLPFGTKVMIPEYFGDKVFVVEDRMHSRKDNNLDVWMPSKAMALRFGIAYTQIVVIE